MKRAELILAAALSVLILSGTVRGTTIQFYTFNYDNPASNPSDPSDPNFDVSGQIWMWNGYVLQAEWHLVTNGIELTGDFYWSNLTQSTFNGSYTLDSNQNMVVSGSWGWTTNLPNDQNTFEVTINPTTTTITASDTGSEYNPLPSQPHSASFTIPTTSMVFAQLNSVGTINWTSPPGWPGNNPAGLAGFGTPTGGGGGGGGGPNNPEPSTFVLMGLGVSALLLHNWQRKRSCQSAMPCD